MYYVYMQIACFVIIYYYYLITYLLIRQPTIQNVSNNIISENKRIVKSPRQ